MSCSAILLTPRYIREKVKNFISNSQECKIEMVVESLADNTVRLLADKVMLFLMDF